MLSCGSDKKKSSGSRALIPVFLILMITFISSAGCIDKGILKSLVEKIEGDEGPDYIWESLLSEQGNFVIAPEGDTDIDVPTILRKVAENLSNFDPTQTPMNMKKIMNEENISMQKDIYKFFVIEGTRNLNIELTGIFSTAASEELSGGYMEITIINPGDKSETIEITQLEEREEHIYSRDPTPGEWTIELQGIGLQPPLDLIYSGQYILSIRAEIPKED